MSTPPVIHQPCGTVARMVSGLGVPRPFVECKKCDRKVPWPNVEFQYQQTAPAGPPPNRILITVQTWYEDAPNPISTEFPIESESARAVERLSNEITRRVRRLMESLNVQTK